MRSRVATQAPGGCHLEILRAKGGGMRSMRVLFLLALLAMLTVLSTAGCGGGGGDGGGGSSTPSHWDEMRWDQGAWEAIP